MKNKAAGGLTAGVLTTAIWGWVYEVHIIAEETTRTYLQGSSEAHITMIGLIGLVVGFVFRVLDRDGSGSLDATDGSHEASRRSRRGRRG